MSKPQSFFESGRFFLVLILAVVAIQGALWFLIHIAYDTLEKQANFGNLFGGINTLFTGLGFAGLVYTIMLQQRAIASQQIELENQARDLQDEKKARERQAFETMLVDMLGFHRQIAREVTIRFSGGELHGQAAMRTLADELAGFVSANARMSGNNSELEKVQRGYEAFRSSYRGVLDHYFRNLYHIVKFIHESSLEPRRRYTSLVRAQLSPAELFLLFYNGLSVHGEKFKPLIERYSLLEQLPDKELQAVAHRTLYDSPPNAETLNPQRPL